MRSRPHSPVGRPARGGTARCRDAAHRTNPHRHRHRRLGPADPTGPAIELRVGAELGLGRTDRLALGSTSGLPCRGGDGAPADRHLRHGLFHRRHSKPGNIRTNQVSTILASDGSELAKIISTEGNRVDININQVPVHVRQAVIAAEDRNFYSNPGFDFGGFARR